MAGRAKKWPVCGDHGLMSAGQVSFGRWEWLKGDKHLW